MKHFKQFFAAFLALLMLLCMMPTAFAATAEEKNYPIQINGVTVTESNRKDILGNGTVSYDPATNILTLKDAYIKSGSLFNIPLVIGTSDQYVESIKIKLVGNSILYTGLLSIPALNAYYCHGLEFIGNGKLTCITEGLNNAFFTATDHILVRGGTITLESKISGHCFGSEQYNTDNEYKFRDKSDGDWVKCENLKELCDHPYGQIAAKSTFQNLMKNIFEPLIELFDRIAYLFKGGK